MPDPKPCTVKCMCMLHPGHKDLVPTQTQPKHLTGTPHRDLQINQAKLCRFGLALCTEGRNGLFELEEGRHY